MSNPRRHARQLAKTLSRAIGYAPNAGRSEIVQLGLVAQADRAHSLCVLGFTTDLQRTSALMFCRELIVQLDAERKVFRDLDRYHYTNPFNREIATARKHVLALREALELDLHVPWYAFLIPERITAALAARAERAARSRARKQEFELVQAHNRVRTELAWDGVRFEPVHRPGGPGRTCKRLVTLAVCVLPANQRARYAEEFRADLWELSRARRLGYAIRLVAFSVSLRRNLLSAAAVAAVQQEHS